MILLSLLNTCRHFKLRLFYHLGNLVRHTITSMFMYGWADEVIFKIFRKYDWKTYLFPLIENKRKFCFPA